MIFIPNTNSAAWAMPGLKFKLAMKTNKGPTYHEIITIVCRYFNVDETLLKRKVRKREIVYMRHISFYLLYRNAHLSLHDIGDKFNCDHTTVIHGKDKVMGQLLSRGENEYKKDINNLITLIP